MSTGLCVHVAVDLVILAVRHSELNVLLIERADEPFAGRRALPGGLVHRGEDLLAGAGRELEEETGIRPAAGHLEQLKTYGAPGRDPRGHVISVAHLALLPDVPDPNAGSDAAGWQPVSITAGLAFDHDEILHDGVERARAKLEYTPMATRLCPAEFTIPELRRVYEAVWGIRLDLRNFHRKVTNTAGFIRPTGQQRAGLSGPAATLYTRDSADILHTPLLRPTATDLATARRAASATKEKTQ